MMLLMFTLISVSFGVAGFLFRRRRNRCRLRAHSLMFVGCWVVASSPAAVAAAAVFGDNMLLLSSCCRCVCWSLLLPWLATSSSFDAGSCCWLLCCSLAMLLWCFVLKLLGCSVVSCWLCLLLLLVVLVLLLLLMLLLQCANLTASHSSSSSTSVSFSCAFFIVSFGVGCCQRICCLLSTRLQ